MKKLIVTVGMRSNITCEEVIEQFYEDHKLQSDKEIEEEAMQLMWEHVDLDYVVEQAK